ncbi:glycerol-3-phosphate acyltransferase [Bacillus sp. CMF12]|uniref:glycerol-3-phosphate acyltransferase n=1 Tax=Bacillaceae TaxID=186817 RepID=UPI001FB26227|nr:MULTISPECIES: glycerol-3-phosphate acyltransferase [Bacillaceae]UOE53271.1 glycerol-3-phosphate acyltransferase [Cytobacillus oceanisediminis]USK47725.1 glycerol-3-phosphate acyltransferase [Bacillus sp. CMF12]
MIDDVWTALMVMIFSYVLGSVTGAYYVVKYIAKEDIRKKGSGNVGATNAGRAIGKKGFLLTIAIDAGKAWAALYVTGLMFEGDGLLILSAVFVLIGHLFPIQLGFHGGKGVVVYLASALFLEPMTIAIMAITMGIAYAVLRKYTRSGFIAMASIPITAWVIGDSFIISAGLLLLLLIVLISHTHFIMPKHRR